MHDRLDVRVVAGETVCQPPLLLLPSYLGGLLGRESLICSCHPHAAFVSAPLFAETQALVASRPAFAQAARALGFPAAALLELHRDDLADLDAAAATVGSWLEGQGLDTSLTRVAVRAEAAGGVLSAGIGMGTEQIVQVSGLGCVQRLVHPDAALATLFCMHFSCRFACVYLFDGTPDWHWCAPCGISLLFSKEFPFFFLPKNDPSLVPTSLT